MSEIMSIALEAFRHNVRALLSEKGMTLTQMAEDLDMSRPGLSRVLNGHDGVSVERAEKIANYLQVPLSALLTPRPRRVAHSA